MDKIQVDLNELTELLNYRREYFKLCDEFKIPLDRRGDPQTAKSIIERIHTYLSSYVMRRSITERENGAAFPPPPPVLAENPELDKSTIG